MMKKIMIDELCQHMITNVRSVTIAVTADFHLRLF